MFIKHILIYIYSYLYINNKYNYLELYQYYFPYLSNKKWRYIHKSNGYIFDSNEKYNLFINFLTKINKEKYNDTLQVGLVPSCYCIEKTTYNLPYCLNSEYLTTLKRCHIIAPTYVHEHTHFHDNIRIKFTDGFIGKNGDVLYGFNINSKITMTKIIIIQEYNQEIIWEKKLNNIKKLSLDESMDGLTIPFISTWNTYLLLIYNEDILITDAKVFMYYCWLDSFERQLLGSSRIDIKNIFENIT